MYDLDTVCRQFAFILKGEAHVKNNVCMVQRDRSSIKVNILGKTSQSGLALHSMWSFESIDYQGKALNLGETVLLQEEVYPFTWHLQRQGIIVTSLHNHWLFDNPPLTYAHYASVEDPLNFARKVAEAYKVLKGS